MKILCFLSFLLLVACSDPTNHPAAARVLSQFKYEEEPKGHDLWQTPAETKARGGDCEDFAIWLREEMIKDGVDPKLIQFVRGQLNGIDHIALRYQGRFYDNYGVHGAYPEFIITGAYSAKFIDLRLAASALSVPAGD